MDKVPADGQTGLLLSAVNPAGGSLLPVCKCGESCRCPACPYTAWKDCVVLDSTIVNPEPCFTCLDCALQNLPDEGTLPSPGPVRVPAGCCQGSSLQAVPTLETVAVSPNSEGGSLVCKCGDSCQCPSCPYHGLLDGEGSSRSEPCMTCLDCALQAMPAEDSLLQPTLDLFAMPHGLEGELAGFGTPMDFFRSDFGSLDFLEV
ncbi:hypothetical protein DFP72DRAFT_420770 [Ephemerocybe angulata]|uniref:Uncharacterized protein n=1 Tax=Ephemerocybe angulata TaxID=980116 RepID=A0A8H6IIC1_9AGAR|nr:hypothetical protein DFP72DRAFT_420770 [Tulosesus angulatus]